VENANLTEFLILLIFPPYCFFLEHQRERWTLGDGNKNGRSRLLLHASRIENSSGLFILILSIIYCECPR